MPAKNDLQHMRGIRKILVKHWIDLGRMRINCRDGHVELGGTITPLFGSNPDFSAEQIGQLIAHIRKLPDTATIDFSELKFNGGTNVTSAAAAGNG